ncbi:MAG: Asp23/Gls24 family envelope stress response protein [Coriobacteriales bacterium]|nr:Asp23/Gls24 family envelope stress response protein [Coriobacteriales bacterium]
MAEQISADGLTIAPGVIETILAQTILQVDGVTRVGSPKPTDGLFGTGKHRNPAQGIILVAEDNQITVSAHICVEYGYRLPEVAEQVRSAIADTLEGQIGVKVAAVDVYVDSVAFPE